MKAKYFILSVCDKKVMKKSVIGDLKRCEESDKRQEYMTKEHKTT